MDMTYSDYLQVEALMELQKCRSDGPEHDEMLFIITHQVYELWFKQVLHEADLLIKRIEAQELAKGEHTLKRILKIFKVLVSQLDILETMTPLEFLSFRKFLSSASGFQSYQFRELEFLLGLKATSHLDRFPEGSSIRKKLEARYHAPSLWHTFLKFLHDKNFSIPHDILNCELTHPTQPSEAVQAVLKTIYRQHPDVTEFCESLVDLDEGIQEWRYRHVKMVERTIGAKIGTGGSLGAEYLKTTLFLPIFPDLWEIRSDF